MSQVLKSMNLPPEIERIIHEYLGGFAYWEARQKLTLYNRKIDMFSSDWWKDWHSYLCWYHWHLNHDKSMVHRRDMNDLVDVSKIPLRFAWLFQTTDKDVVLLLKMYKASVTNRKLLYVLNLKLEVMYEYWLSHVRYYRNIVF